MNKHQSHPTYLITLHHSISRKTTVNISDCFKHIYTNYELWFAILLRQFFTDKHCLWILDANISSSLKREQWNVNSQTKKIGVKWSITLSPDILRISFWKLFICQSFKNVLFHPNIKRKMPMFGTKENKENHKDLHSSEWTGIFG